MHMNRLRIGVLSLVNWLMAAVGKSLSLGWLLWLLHSIPICKACLEKLASSWFFTMLWISCSLWIFFFSKVGQGQPKSGAQHILLIQEPTFCRVFSADFRDFRIVKVRIWVRALVLHLLGSIKIIFMDGNYIYAI